jgi:hypothetical protein
VAESSGIVRSRGRRAFISYFGGADLRGLSEILVERGYEPQTAGDLATGSFASRSLVETVADADLVVVVFGNERESPNAAFELGIAIASGKRPLVIAPKDTALPLAVSDLVVVRGSTDNLHAIGEAVDAVERLAGVAPRDPAAARKARPLGDDADRFLATLLTASGSHDAGREVERVVAEALVAGGVRAVYDGGPGGSDLVVWDEALEASMGLPLPVEVIDGPGLNFRTLRLKINALQAAVSAQPGPSWALLVIGPSMRPPTTADISHNSVLTVGATELIEQMRNATFADVVRRLRNRRVHG